MDPIPFKRMMTGGTSILGNPHIKYINDIPAGMTSWKLAEVAPDPDTDPADAVKKAELTAGWWFQLEDHEHDRNGHLDVAKSD